jgi:hypothetical protein
VSCVQNDLRGGMVVLGDSWRGIRLGLTCHRATISRASSAETVEGAFFLAVSRRRSE